MLVILCEITVLLSRMLSTLTSTLFPYTTLFRSLRLVGPEDAANRAVGVVERNDQPVVVPGRGAPAVANRLVDHLDRKSTRLNSSHTVISYAVFCLKKKKNSSRAADPSLLSKYSP